MNSKRICIIGGGFSGTMTAVHLLEQSTTPVHITLVNSGYPLAKGVAYSSYSNNHLLNVVAKNMSAFPDRLNHFAEWLHQEESYSDKEEISESFAPRNLYGKYLKSIFDNAIQKKHRSNSITIIHDEAIDLEVTDFDVRVFFSVSPSIHADRVLMATGNQVPASPHIPDASFFSGSQNYFGNPWIFEAINNLNNHHEVLIIGNGLTMADVVIALKEKGHLGKIHSLSPHGFGILPHRKIIQYPDLVNELKEPYDIISLLNLFRKHVRKLKSKDVSGESVVDSLRPFTQKIWMSWEHREKKLFMHHLRHIWGVARHRLPMQIFQQLQEFIQKGELQIIAGRLIKIEDSQNSISVHFKQRKSQHEQVLQVHRVINCTGPQSNILKLEKTLFKNMLSRKLICADEMNLGIMATPDGQIICNGKKSEFLYTIGTNLKGVLWESVAVPELRHQAKKTAEIILN